MLGKRLEGKVAIITGAGSGIAKASAKLFAAQGARVVLAEINDTLGEQCEKEIVEAGGEVFFVQTDVTDEASVQQLMDATIERFGALHVLFNCAGGSVGEDRPVLEVDMELWQHTQDLDLKGPFLCCKYGIPHLIEAGGGTVVNVSSGGALRGIFPAHIYATAKGGLLSLTRCLAGEYSTQGVRTNVICPGLTLTDRILNRYTESSSSEGEKTEQQKAANHNMLKRYPFAVGQPEDIANVALFLASDESRMINGAVIPAEGGMHAY